MTLDQAKNLGQILAWLAAAGYFFYKLISGYLIGNASLRLTCTRSAPAVAPTQDAAGPANGQAMDYLSIVAIVKRGTGTTTLALHDARARVTLANGQALPTAELEETKTFPADVQHESKLIATERLSSDTIDDVLEITFHTRSRERPLLNLAPGDEMQFATVYTVPQIQPCIAWKRSQWRASDISLPISQDQ